MCHILFFQATWISPTVHIVHLSEVEACGFQSEVKTNQKTSNKQTKLKELIFCQWRKDDDRHTLILAVPKA